MIKYSFMKNKFVVMGVIIFVVLMVVLIFVFVLLYDFSKMLILDCL